MGGRCFVLYSSLLLLNLPELPGKVPLGLKGPLGALQKVSSLPKIGKKKKKGSLVMPEQQARISIMHNLIFWLSVAVQASLHESPPCVRALGTKQQ